MSADTKTNKTETWTIDELLERQEQAASAATIEAVAGKPAVVKVTPWVANAGCLCHLAIEVPKDSIESVTANGQKHHCCGKVLSVVEVKFRERSQMPLSEIFAQLGSKAMAHDDHDHAPAHLANGFPTVSAAFPAMPPMSAYLLSNCTCAPGAQHCVYNAKLKLRTCYCFHPICRQIEGGMELESGTWT